MINHKKIIEVNNVVTKFGKNLVHDGINLHVNEGEIYGFLGPSGAGKTTMEGGAVSFGDSLPRGGTGVGLIISPETYSINYANAAALTTVSDTIVDSDLSVQTDHTIVFTTPTGISDDDFKLLWARQHAVDEPRNAYFVMKRLKFSDKERYIALATGLGISSFREKEKYLIPSEVDKDDLKKYDYQIGDAEGIVNHPLMMEKINMSILLSERDKQIRISFRSKGEFSVNDLARKYFKGGGHRNAAGGKTYLTMEKTIDKIKTTLKEYKEQLDYKLSY